MPLNCPAWSRVITGQDKPPQLAVFLYSMSEWLESSDPLFHRWCWLQRDRPRLGELHTLEGFEGGLMFILWVLSSFFSFFGSVDLFFYFG